MSNRLKVAVVGVGYLGRFHALIYSRMPEVELVGVADSDAKRGRGVAEEAGCEFYANASDLLDKVDAVSIVVPTSYHLEVARPFLRAGIHMLMEKPIADGLDAGREIVELADQAGAVLQIGHLERFNAGVMALADRLDTPRFIEAHRMSPFVARATDVDVVSDLMIHDIDIILALVKSEIRSIAAIGTPVLTKHIDIANARLEFENGTVANVIASRVSEATTRRIRVFEKNRYLSLDFIGQTIDMAAPRPTAEGEWPEIVTERIKIEPVKPLDAEIAAFVESVQTGKTPLVHGRVGLKALEVALQVKEKIMS